MGFGAHAACALGAASLTCRRSLGPLKGRGASRPAQHVLAQTPEGGGIGNEPLLVRSTGVLVTIAKGVERVPLWVASALAAESLLRTASPRRPANLSPSVRLSALRCARTSLACLVDESSTMLIARSTCSEPGVRRSDPSVRSPGKRTREPQRKQIRFGLVTPMFAANLPELVKPDMDPEATSVCRGSANRGDWERRARKDMPRNLGDPTRWRRSNRVAECIRRHGPGRKSDAFIVARKGVTTLERRDATVGQRSTRQGVPLDRKVAYGKKRVMLPSRECRRSAPC